MICIRKLKNNRILALLIVGMLLATQIFLTLTVRAEVDRSIIIDNGDPGYSEFGTLWGASGLPGYNGTSTRFGYSADAYATWQPQLTAGMYEVFIYKVVHSSNDTNAKIDIVHAGGTDTKYLNYTQGTSGWVSLGVYNFLVGSSGYVRIKFNTGIFRTDAVKFQEIVNPTLASLTRPTTLVDVAVDRQIELIFNKDMDISTMNMNTITLQESASGSPVDASFTAGAKGRIFTIVPLQNLKYNTLYQLAIREDLKDVYGKIVYGTKIWTFTTALNPNSKYIILQPEDFLFSRGTWSIENAPNAFGGSNLVGATNKQSPDGSVNTVPASAYFKADTEGNYRIWMHTKDYTASYPRERKFKARVNDVLLDEVFGDHGVNGWSWEDGGIAHLNLGINKLELIDISAFWARVDSIYITNQLDEQPPASYTELENINVQNDNLQQKLAFPQWAQSAAQPSQEFSIENANVHVSFYSVPTSNGQVIQKQMSVKNGDGWLPVEDRIDPFGYLLMYSENVPVESLKYNICNILKVNRFNREFEWMIPTAITQLDDNKIELTAENDYARLTALWEITADVKEPIVKVTLEAKQHGTYSIGIFNGKEKTLEEIDSLLLPFQLTNKRIYSQFSIVPEWLTSTTVSLMSFNRETGGQFTYGIAVDPASIPDHWARINDSKFGLAINGLNGGVQPSVFAPLYGTTESVFQQGQLYEFTYRPFVRQGEWFDSYKHVVENIYGMKDYRKNYYSSFTDAIFNTQKLAMDDDHSGWDATAKSHYNMEGKNTETLAAPLTYIQSYLLTEDKDIYEKRTIPIIEALLSRSRHHFSMTGDTNNYLGRNSITQIGSPILGYGNNTFGAAYLMTRSLSSMLKDVGIDDGIKNENRYMNVPEWHQNLALYKYTGNTSYLDLAKTQADDYLNNTVYKTVYNIPSDLEFINISYAPYWNGLIDLYEATGDNKYIQGASYAAKRWIVSLWTQPIVKEGLRNVYANDIRENPITPEGWVGFWKGSVQDQIGHPEGLDSIQDETVPAWLTSRVGLGLEQKITFQVCNSENILLSPWAPDLLRLAQYTGDNIFEKFARNAMIGRFSNYPGYGYNKDSVIQMKPDYPYNGPDLNGIYYHHIPVHLSVDVDFLVTQIWKWSNGRINFPSVRQQGYAYFSNRHYGFEAGSFFDEEDMWIWLKEGLVTVDNMQIDWLGARKDRRFAVALINEDTAEQSVTVTLGDDITGGTAYNGRATIYDADGKKSYVSVQNSQITLTVPGHDLIGIALDSEAVRKPAYADVPAQEIFNSSEEGTTAATGPTADFGKGMVLQIDPDSYYAYVYTTFLPTQASKVVLYWHNGDGNWQQVENSTYPYEFTVKMDDMSKSFHYYIKVLDSSGNWLTSNEAQLKPKVYLAKATLQSDKSALKVGGGVPFTIMATMSDKQTADLGNAQISFESSDPSVAEVADNRIIAKSVGTTNIKATVIINGVTRESNKLHIIVDQVPPVTSIKYDGESSNGWYSSNVQLELIAVDDSSGVAETAYSLDDGNTWMLYNQPIVLVEEGVHEVKFYSTDKAGNVEQTVTSSASIDKTPPTVSIAIYSSTINDGMVFDDAEQLSSTVNTMDQLSGVAEELILIDGVPYEEDDVLDMAGKIGQHTITVSVKDMAGNNDNITKLFNITTSIPSMQQLINRYKTSNSLNGPLAAQLDNALDQAEHQLDKGDKMKAAKHMEDFLKHLNNKEMQSYIEEAAKNVLNTDTNALIKLWSN